LELEKYSFQPDNCLVNYLYLVSFSGNIFLLSAPHLLLQQQRLFAYFEQIFGATTQIFNALTLERHHNLIILYWGHLYICCLSNFISCLVFHTALIELSPWSLSQGQHQKMHYNLANQLDSVN